MDIESFKRGGAVGHGSIHFESNERLFGLDAIVFGSCYRDHFLDLMATDVFNLERNIRIVKGIGLRSAFVSD